MCAIVYRPGISSTWADLEGLGRLHYNVTALLYVRQSRTKTNTISPEVQEAKCRTALEPLGVDQVVVYRDLNRTGGSTKRREAYRAMIGRIEAAAPSEIGAVALYDQSRGFRNKLDAYRFFALLESKPWIEVVFGDGSTFDRSNSGELTWAVKAAVAEYELKEIGRRNRDVKRAPIARRQMVGPVPLGHRRVERNVELDPEWAPVVQSIFQLYAGGSWSSRKIAQRLNAEGRRPPSLPAGWRADTLAQMLGHPAYIGLMPVDGRQGRGELVSGDWPPLVDESTWKAVQAIRLRNKTKPRGAGLPFRIYAFQSVIHCGECDARMYGHTLHSGRYYHCRSSGTYLGCGLGVREDALLPWGRSLMKWLESRPHPDLETELRRLRRRPHRPPDAVAQVEATIARMDQRYEWGHFEIPEKEADYLRRRAELVQLRRQLEAEQHRVATIQLTGLVQAWDTGDMLTRRNMISALFEVVEVAKGGRVIGVKPRPEVAAELTHYLGGWPGLEGEAVKLRFA